MPATTIPPVIRASLDRIWQIEGGYNPHDKNNLPTFHGITTDTWQIWAKQMGHPLTTKQAADDLRAIANHGGKSYTGINFEQFHEIFYERSYKSYLTKRGFDNINSSAIQSYVLEDSFRRGPDSARWMMNNITEIEPDHADPLLKNRIPASTDRKDAVAAVNGFLTTGLRNRIAQPGEAVDPTAERRLYGRMRTVSIMQEMHLIADRGLPELSSGLLKRAFEFPWALGLSKEHPGLDPVADRELYNRYNTYKVLYDQYTNDDISKKSFVNQVMAMAHEELCDPHSPINKGGIPPSCKTAARTVGDDITDTPQAQDITVIPPSLWPTNAQLGDRLYGDYASKANFDHMVMDIGRGEKLDLNTLNHYLSNPNKPAPVMLHAKGVEAVQVQYRNWFHHEAIAIDIPGKGSFQYDIDKQGNFQDFKTELPQGVTPVMIHGIQSITWKSDDQVPHVIPLSSKVNNRIREAERVRHVAINHHDIKLPNIEPALNFLHIPIPSNLPDHLHIPNISHSMKNMFFNMEKNPAALAFDAAKEKLLNSVRSPDHHDEKPVPFWNLTHLAADKIGEVVNKHVHVPPHQLNKHDSAYLVVETPEKLSHQRFVVESADLKHVIGAPAGTTLPNAPKVKGR